MEGTLRPFNRVVDGRKLCADCGETKAVAEFGKKKQYVTEMCRTCQGIRARMIAYNLTRLEVVGLLAQGACEACGAETSGRRAHIDHCHDTGRVRGLLCHQCNVALGAIHEDLDAPRGLIAYVERHLLAQ